MSNWQLINQVTAGASPTVCKMGKNPTPYDERPYGEALLATYPNLKAICEGRADADVASREIAQLIDAAIERGSYALVAAAAVAMAANPVVSLDLPPERALAFSKLGSFSLGMEDCSSCWRRIRLAMERITQSPRSDFQQPKPSFGKASRHHSSSP